MDPETLIPLLRASAEQRGERTPTCPDEDQLAAYVDGTLAPEVSESLDTHLADCGWCLAVIGLLSRHRESLPLERVSDLQVAAAHRLVTTQKRRAPRVSGWAAAAAVACVSIVVATQYSQLPGADGLPKTDLPALRTTRNAASDSPDLQVFAPEAGTTVDGRRLSFRWSAVPGSDYYDVRIVNDAGNLVADQRVEGTEWKPAASLALDPGAEYFVQVEAHPSQAKSISSDHVPFLVSD